MPHVRPTDLHGLQALQVVMRFVSAALALALHGCGSDAGQFPQAPAAAPDRATPERAPPAAPSPDASLSNSGLASPRTLAEWRIAEGPRDVRVLPGEAAGFAVRVEGGTGEFEYQWLRDGQPVEGAVGSQYSWITTIDDGGAEMSVRVRPRGTTGGHDRESVPATVGWRDMP